jgi:hypothetical protein
MFAADDVEEEGVMLGRVTGSALPRKYLSIHCSLSPASALLAAADDDEIKALLWSVLH